MARPTPFPTAALLALFALSPFATAGTTTQADLVREAVAANRRLLVDAYDAVPRDAAEKAKWDEPAHAFLDRMAVRFGEAGFDEMYCGDVDTSIPTMEALAAKVERCPDPLVTYCRAVVYKDGGHPEDFNALVMRVGPKLVAGPYPVYRRFNAAAAMARLQPENAKLAGQRDALLLPMLVDAGTDRFLKRRAFAAMDSELWQGNGVYSQTKPEERLKTLDALAADPKTDPWLLDVLRGTHEIFHAWECRGGGFAGTVTDEGWKGFHEHVEKAAEALERAYKADPTMPESSRNMLTVCMARSDRRGARLWFDRNKAAQIDDLQAWRNYTEMLKPKWGGSIEAMLALGKEAVATGRFDTVTPYYLTEQLAETRAESGEGYTLYRRPGVWDAARTMYDGYIASGFKGIDVAWNHSNRAACAVRCGAYDAAKKSIDAAGDRLDERAFTKFDLDAGDARGECAAHTGPQRQTLGKADEAERGGAFDEAARAYDTAAAALPAGDAGRAFCRWKAAACRLSGDLAAGKSVSLPLGSDADLKAWTPGAADWSSQAGELVFAGAADTEATLPVRLDLPRDCRVKMEWSYAVPEAGHAPGLHLGFQQTTQGLLSVLQYPKQNTVVLGIEHAWRLGIADAKHNVPVDLSPGAWHTLDVTHRGDTAVINSDDEPLLRVQNDWLRFNGEPKLSLKACASKVGGTIRVRKLTLIPLQ